MKHNIKQLLKSVNGASFISINTNTEPSLSGGKKNTMKGRVRKITTGSNVMVFQNKRLNGYEQMVNRRLVEEGKDPASFELQPRKWGMRIDNEPIVEHKGQYYLEVIFLKSGKTTFQLDGIEIPRSDVEGLKDAVEAEQGGLDNKVVIRSYKLDSITQMTIDNETYNGEFVYE